MPIVSVIIPNYNHLGYLERRIDSVISQTLDNHEVIILDDCSSDGSRQVIEAYRNHPKVSSIIYNDTNSGNTFKQWSKGIAAAKGELIWIAESDDFCEATFLEELVSPLLQNEALALSFCQSIVVTPDEKILYLTHSTSLSETIAGDDFVQRYMLGGNIILNASMVVFRKSLVSKITVPYQDMKYCGDWFFWVNLCLHGNVFISGKYLNYFLRHPGSVAPQAARRGLDFVEGNGIYRFITEQLNVSRENKLNALRTRLALFDKKKHLFENAAVYEEVKRSLLQLDPKMSGLVRRHQIKKGLARLYQKIDRLLE